MPDTCKTGVINLILKPDKNKLKPEGYRPITLLNTMCKILKKLINSILSWFLEKSNIFLQNKTDLGKTAVQWTVFTKFIKKLNKHLITNK